MKQARKAIITLIWSSLIGIALTTFSILMFEQNSSETNLTFFCAPAIFWVYISTFFVSYNQTAFPWIQIILLYFFEIATLDLIIWVFYKVPHGIIALLKFLILFVIVFSTVNVWGGDEIESIGIFNWVSLDYSDSGDRLMPHLTNFSVFKLLEEIVLDLFMSFLMFHLVFRLHRILKSGIERVHVLKHRVSRMLVRHQPSPLNILHVWKKYSWMRFCIVFFVLPTLLGYVSYKCGMRHGYFHKRRVLFSRDIKEYRRCHKEFLKIPNDVKREYHIVDNYEIMILGFERDYVAPRKSAP